MLDAGCGRGSLTSALAQRAKNLQIEGINSSPQYVEHATGQNHSPNITFRVGDICALPFADASFDRVLSHSSFTSFPTPNMPLRNYAVSPVRARRSPRPCGMQEAGGRAANLYDAAAALGRKAMISVRAISPGP